MPVIVTHRHYSVAGIGFAGAGRLDSEDIPPPFRDRIDLQKLRTKLPELQRLSHISLTLMEEEHQRRDRPPGPFAVLKEVELIVSSIAQALAPKRIQKPGETRRSFGFEGQQVFYRELNLLRKATAVVSRVINQDQCFLQSPFRQLRWLAAIQALHKRIGRSKHTVSIPLAGPMTEYLLPERRGILKRWESQAGQAIAQGTSSSSP